MAWRLVPFLGRMVLRDAEGTETPLPPPTDPTPTVGTPVTDGLTFAQRLKGWTAAESYELLDVTYDATVTDVIYSATVKWPDGSLGVFTAHTIDATLHQWTSYSITHVNSGAKVTQAAVTRNANGLITIKPALAVTGI